MRYRVTIEQGMAGHSETFDTIAELADFLDVWLRPGVDAFIKAVEDES